MGKDEFNNCWVMKVTPEVKEVEFLKAIQFGNIRAIVRSAFFQSWLKVLRPYEQRALESAQGGAGMGHPACFSKPCQAGAGTKTTASSGDSIKHIYGWYSSKHINYTHEAASGPFCNMTNTKGCPWMEEEVSSGREMVRRTQETGWDGDG